MKNFETVSLLPGLYLVATPIGNLRDMTLRGMDVLAAVDLIVCEDTRVTGKLLKAIGIEKKMIAYNDHNAGKQRGPILERLSNDGKIALVSDAGMPLVSDPGYKLVRDCLDLGLRVTTMPGANAPLAALQLSGQPSDKFSFLGFLPPKSEARRKVMGQWGAVPSTLIVFESGPRLVDSLSDMLAVWGSRPAAVVRELTKLYEESRRGTLEELVKHYEEDGAPKGEIVVVIGPPLAATFDAAALDEKLAEAMETMGVKEASAAVAEQTGESKKTLYERALALKNKVAEEDA
ncbi:MAG: 16S rRNA (cytidine(1402)-2'-O)-methyltransferase [Rhodospirillales bacterium]|nr:16S rRNA (cytidine(1402)-2'-O)-methyltransferase [Rhodospirillales bacterium]MCB9994963.1 16S rRNA (cytidine(1402)-2'-O)-methyltransferase [Rhodospirillales bacterium]